MSQFAKFVSAAALGLLLITAIGCGKSATDPAVISAHRTRLTLTEEPSGAQTVADVRLTLLGGHDDHEGHEHDGDGHQDHDAADHDDHAHDDHEGHEHDGDGHQDHDAADHDDHDDHDDHAHDDHEGHEHDGDGHQDHDAADHDDHAHGDHNHDDHAHDDHAQHDHDEHGHAHATEPQEVSIVGHIGGGLSNPWDGTQKDYPFAKTEAVLFLADPEAVIENEASGHVHAPGEECAICAANAPSNVDKLAIVQFVDENGKVLKVGTQQLFDVKENDMVVIRGMARITEGGILVVNAKGLYLRQ